MARPGIWIVLCGAMASDLTTFMLSQQATLVLLQNLIEPMLRSFALSRPTPFPSILNLFYSSTSFLPPTPNPFSGHSLSQTTHPPTTPDATTVTHPPPTFLRPLPFLHCARDCAGCVHALCPKLDLRSRNLCERVRAMTA